MVGNSLVAQTLRSKLNQKINKKNKQTSIIFHQLLGFGLLHIAAGLRSPECVRLVELLLKAGADPNMTAQDENVGQEASKRKKVSESDY